MNISQNAFGNEYIWLDSRQRHTHVYPNSGLTSDVSTVRAARDLVSRTPVIIPDPSAPDAPIALRKREGGGFGAFGGFTFSRPQSASPERDAARLQTVQEYVTRHYDEHGNPRPLPASESSGSLPSESERDAALSTTDEHA